MIAHGIFAIYAGQAFELTTDPQIRTKKLRVVSLLQTPPNQPARSNQPFDPDAPPPAPGVAGLPLNITSADGLPDLPGAGAPSAPNPAFDPFASSVVEISPQTPSSPITPNSVAQAPPNNGSANTTPKSDNNGPTLSDEDFENWLNGADRLPALAGDPRVSNSLPSPGAPTGPVANNTASLLSDNVGGANSNSVNSSNGAVQPTRKELAPPGETVTRTIAYDYPKAACKDRLEGKAEYRIWVTPQATPYVSDITISTESPILDQAVKTAAQKYKITADDASKLVILPFDIKYSQKACEQKDTTPSSEPTLDPKTPKPSEPPAASPTPLSEDKPSPPSPEVPSPAPSPAAPAGSPPTAPVEQPTPSPLPNPPQLTPLSPQPAVQPPVPKPPSSSPAQSPEPLQAPPSNSEEPSLKAPTAPTDTAEPTPLAPPAAAPATEPSSVPTPGTTDTQAAPAN